LEGFVVAEKNCGVAGQGKYSSVVVAGKNVLPLEEVSEIIRKLEASGLSMWAVAKQEGMPYTTLRGYMRRLKKAGLEQDLKPVAGKSRSGFVELVSDNSAGTTFSLNRSGFQLEFPLSSLSLVLAELEKHA